MATGDIEGIELGDSLIMWLVPYSFYELGKLAQSEGLQWEDRLHGMTEEETDQWIKGYKTNFKYNRNVKRNSSKEG